MKRQKASVMAIMALSSLTAFGPMARGQDKNDAKPAPKPEPKPEVIAGYATHSPALALSKGLDRDRGVDETGHQIAVFGRRGSGPFTLDEMRKLYLDVDGQPWFAQPIAK